jgi:putative liporotein
MKKGIITIGLGAVLMSCTNAKLVQYNTDRLDTIEDYLRENKFIKPSENVEKLKEEGKINYSKEYRSLEKEADAWLEEQQ